MKRRCDYCGKAYEARRSTSRYCCSSCRGMAYRMRGLPIYPKPAAPVYRMSEDEVLDVVANAHGAAADMSRAAARTAQPLAGALGRCAAAFEEALEREGL